MCTGVGENLSRFTTKGTKNTKKDERESKAFTAKRAKRRQGETNRGLGRAHSFMQPRRDGDSVHVHSGGAPGAVVAGIAVQVVLEVAGEAEDHGFGGLG